jgi:hypothetical protein
MRKYVLFSGIGGAALAAILVGILLALPAKRASSPAEAPHNTTRGFISDLLRTVVPGAADALDDLHREIGAPLDLQYDRDLQYGLGPNNELAKIVGLGRALERLPKGKIYLDAPIEMKVGDKRTVDARVGVNVPDEVLRGHARAGDQSIGGTLGVSHEMIATLSGPGFAITRTTPEKQTVAEGFPTVWQWDIEAKQNGTQELEATLYALVPERQRIDAYTQKITVTVKPLTVGEWLKSTGEEIGTIKAIVLPLGAIAAAILSWFGISLRRQRRSPTTPRVRRRQSEKRGDSGDPKPA